MRGKGVKGSRQHQGPLCYRIWVAYLEASRRAAMTSSLTALAFAPGVLKTGIPSSVILGTGMLFTPAPQRTMHRTVDGTSSSLS